MEYVDESGKVKFITKQDLLVLLRNIENTFSTSFSNDDISNVVRSKSTGNEYIAILYTQKYIPESMERNTLLSKKQKAIIKVIRGLIIGEIKQILAKEETDIEKVRENMTKFFEIGNKYKEIAIKKIGIMFKMCLCANLEKERKEFEKKSNLELWLIKHRDYNCANCNCKYPGYLCPIQKKRYCSKKCQRMDWIKETKKKKRAKY